MASRDYYDENEERPAGHHRREPEERYDREGDRYDNDGQGRAQHRDRDEFGERRQPQEGGRRMNECESDRREGNYNSENRGGNYNRRDDADERRADSYQRQDDSYQRQGESYGGQDEGFRREGEGFSQGSGGYGRDDNDSREGRHHGGQRRNEEIYGDQRTQGRFNEESNSRYDDQNPPESRMSHNYPPRDEYGSQGYGRDGREGAPQGDSYSNDRPSERYGRGDNDNQSGLQGSGRYGGQHGGSSGDGELFSSTLNSLPGHQQRLQNESLDEGQAISAHQQMYGGGGAGSAQAATSDSMGSAAAMQALRMFTGGQGSHPQGANAQESFIRMAMGEAAQLFDQQSAQGNAHPSASKQDAVSSAAQLALKMFMKSQGDGGSGGSGLMGLASKFLS